MKKLLWLSSILMLGFFSHLSPMRPSPMPRQQFDISIPENIIKEAQQYTDGSKGLQAKSLAKKAIQYANEAIDIFSYTITPGNADRVRTELQQAIDQATVAITQLHTYTQLNTPGTSPTQQPRTPSPARSRTPSPAIQTRQLTFEQAIAELPRLTTWIDYCNQLPFLHSILTEYTPEQIKSSALPGIFQQNTPEQTIVSMPIFTAIMDRLISYFNAIKNKADWLTPLSNQNPTYVQKDNAFFFKPIYFHADFHGDVKSLVAFLQDLKNQNIINDVWQVADGNKIVFLGDYIDRGFYGLEVLYTLMILKLYNPQNVYILRGNHEDNKIYTNYNWGEIEKKLSNLHIDPRPFFSKLDAFFETLPSALFFKMPNNRFLLFTHGAHNHTDVTLKDFLNNPIKNYNAFALSNDEQSYAPFNAYSWSEYEPIETPETQPLFNVRRNSGYLYNKIPTITWMNEHAVDTIIHGHQHTQTQLWDADYQEQAHNPKGRVYGLPITPDTTYGKALQLSDDVYGSIIINNATRQRATEIKLERKRIIPVRPMTPMVSAAPAAPVA